MAVAFPAMILPFMAARAIAVFLQKDEFYGVLTALGLGRRSSGSFEVGGWQGNEWVLTGLAYFGSSEWVLLTTHGE